MRPLRLRRLHTRIYLHFLGVLFVVGALTTAVFALGYHQGEPDGPTLRVSRRVAASVGERFEDRPAWEAALRQLAHEADVDITVRDAGGRALLSIGPELPAPPGPKLLLLRKGPRTIWSGSWLRDDKAWFVAAPIPDRAGERQVGLLEVSFMRLMPPRVLLRSVWIVALVLLAVAGATRPLARRMSWPVERLTEANRRLGTGDLSYRIPIPPQAAQGHPGWHGRRGFYDHEGWHGPWAFHGRRGFYGRWRRRGKCDELGELLFSWNEMAERIEGLMRGQKELLANVSHELRSPLARIRMALALLPEEAAAEARLKDVETDLGELERLIDDVLTTSRLEQSGLPMHMGHIEAQALLGSLRERAEGDPALQGKVQLQAGPELALVGDPALLRRALWNLIENAAKYGAPPILLGAGPGPGAGDDDNDEVVFTVTDHGPGIASAERQLVFQPFYRADKAHTPAPAGQGRGFGLGLTLVSRVAEVHGGTVRIEPAEKDGERESGCRFVLTIPRRPREPSSIEGGPAPPERPGTAPRDRWG